MATFTSKFGPLALANCCFDCFVVGHHLRTYKGVMLALSVSIMDTWHVTTPRVDTMVRDQTMLFDHVEHEGRICFQTTDERTLMFSCTKHLI
jgi:hypothetical protein